MPLSTISHNLACEAWLRKQTKKKHLVQKGYETRPGSRTNLSDIACMNSDLQAFDHSSIKLQAFRLSLSYFSSIPALVRQAIAPWLTKTALGSCADAGSAD
jgi:hypothetical protein